ncbi:NF-kappa-B inhibitor zeta [Melipona quadrifasciata]|uniref:NF-kappa-B inhibitor zeta n=1 Tax=Melipona quadrifasciata TaxID=166423 RepID=A0A0N0U689_9HYME|nr:NF-kappa-B inhibitor zeta [Melipona quadrifasciata]
MKIRQGSSNIINISTMSMPRNQNTMPHSTTSYSSNDIEDVIEKIDNLRLARNQSNEIHGLDVHRTKLKERGVTGCQTSKSINTYDREHKYNKENNRDDLIERGPIKSQFCPLSRSQPYCTRAEQPRFFEKADETCSIDYDKTAEQILRDKECSEKLNACLDQLQNLERTNYNYSDNNRDQSVPQVCGLRKDLSSTPSTIVDDILSDEFLLLENVICGAFQAAQPVTRENFDFSLIVSNSESHESSRAHSPVFPNSTQSPGRTQQNSNHSPASSPQVINIHKARLLLIFFLSDFSNSDRSTIPPWPSLNLPSVKASEKLKEKLNPKEVKKAMISLLKRPVEELVKQDKDGDTKLMCLVGNPNELIKKMAYLVPLVERMSTITGALTITNDRGFDALYLTALNCPEFPFVAGYLAAAMIQKGIDISQRLYHTRGDTLIHSIAAQGDSHNEILSELLALTTIQENRLFDLSKRNYDGRTALHIAIESHLPFTKGTTSLETVKLLLKYGADPTIKETKCGNNALHMAVSLDCDPILVKLLLDTWTSDLVNAVNYNHDTALHVATAKSTNITLNRQEEVCWLLVQAGSRTDLLNQQGKTPLALASVDRKETIREILHKRS